jgi:hypothetical protein
VENAKPQEVANTCWSFATLGVHAPSFFAAVDKRGEWLVKIGDPQAVSNVCWAAGILGLLGRNDNLVIACWNAAMAIPLNSLSVAELHQLHEVDLCVQIEGGEKLKSSLLSMPRELREAIDKAVAESVNKSSRRQEEVSSALTSIGFNHEVEVSPFSNAGGNAPFMAIDMACRDRMIAVEFNGPSHYNSDGQPNGKTMMKKRLLKKLGWQLHTIPWQAWVGLKGKTEKVNYLKGGISKECWGKGIFENVDEKR